VPKEKRPEISPASRVLIKPFVLKRLLHLATGAAGSAGLAGVIMGAGC